MRASIFLFAGLLFCFTASAVTPANLPPDWAKNAIWYQIFVERFNNGDPSNDPTPALMRDDKMKIIPPEGWKITPWTQSWYHRDEWMQDRDFNQMLQYRRYGGDLQGVLIKIAYLKKLGINAVFFNPLNDAPSLHKYDARKYHHIDVNFGPDPQGDLKLMATENPADSKTWVWTSADKLFLELVKQLHQNGIRVIMDYSWNHTGTMHWAWLDVLKNQSNSVCKDWYNITRFDDPATLENEFKYEGWMGNAYMPEVKKVDITTHRQPGHPYEGNIHPIPKQHIFDVTRRWLAPDGDTSAGIDGFRLDVADHIGLGFWRDWRTYVRSINPEAYLVGEIWWQQWPNTLMDPAPYTQGDVFDAVMYYQVYKPARNFFVKTVDELNAQQFKDSLLKEWGRVKKPNLYAMMNVSSTHDAPRLLTDFYNTNKYKYHANTNEDPTYKTGKPDAETYQRLKLYLIHLFTTVGAPQIWNGEEMGMWGGDDPHCRKPLMWPELNYEPEVHQALQKGDLPADEVKMNDDMFAFYHQLIEIRKNNAVLNSGGIPKFVVAAGKVLGYERTDGKTKILVLFNLSDKDYVFNSKENYKELLTNKNFQKNLILKPLSAGIYLRLKK